MSKIPLYNQTYLIKLKDQYESLLKLRNQQVKLEQEQISENAKKSLVNRNYRKSKGINIEEPRKKYDNSELELLDRNILGALTFIEANLTHWIYQDFNSAAVRIKEIWKEIFIGTIKNYCCEVEAFKSDYTKLPVSYRKSYDRLLRVCKNLTNFYRELIKRILNVYGSTDDIYKLFEPLGLSSEERVKRNYRDGNTAVSGDEVDVDMLNYESVTSTSTSTNSRISFKQSPTSQQPTLRQILQIILCNLGDICRYRAKFNYKFANSQEAKNDIDQYKHSWIYYRTAISIDSSASAPYFLLAKNIYEENPDAIFGALYWCCRGNVASDKVRSNVIKLAGIFQGSRIEVMDADIWSKCHNRDDRERELTKYIKHLKITSKCLTAEYYMTENKYKNDWGHIISQQLKQLTNWISGGILTEKALIRLSLLQIMFLDISEKIVKDTDTAYDPGEPDYPGYYILFRINIQFIGIMIEQVISFFESDLEKDEDWFKIRDFLPSLRIYLNWFRLYLRDHLNNVFLSKVPCVKLTIDRLTTVLEIFRNRHGFKYDIKTVKPIMDLKDLGSLLDEEMECLNFNPIKNEKIHNNSGIILLSDCPNELERPFVPKGPHNDNTVMKTIDRYRLQCILFGGLELTRDRPTFLQMDDVGFRKCTFYNSDEGDEVVMTPRRRKRDEPLNNKYK